MINKNKFSIKDTKKVLHKVGKRWVVVSAVLLGLAAGGAAVTTANADTTAQAAQPTVAQQVTNNANVSAANHSFGAADPANATKAPASSTMKLGAEQGDNDSINIKGHNVPTTKQGIENDAKHYASYANVYNLSALASKADTNNAKAKYSDLVNLASNAPSQFNSYEVGSDVSTNSNANTLFGILNDASSDINAINNGNSNSKLTKISHALSDVQSLASYNSSRTIKLSVPNEPVSVNVPRSVPLGSVANTVNSSLSAMGLSGVSLLPNQTFPVTSFSSTYDTSSASASMSASIPVNIPSIINNGISESTADSLVSSLVHTFASTASESVTPNAKSFAESLASSNNLASQVASDIYSNLASSNGFLSNAVASATPYFNVYKNANTAYNTLSDAAKGGAAAYSTNTEAHVILDTALNSDSTTKPFASKIENAVKSDPRIMDKDTTIPIIGRTVVVPALVPKLRGKLDEATNKVPSTIKPLLSQFLNPNTTVNSIVTGNVKNVIYEKLNENTLKPVIDGLVEQRIQSFLKGYINQNVSNLKSYVGLLYDDFDGKFGPFTKNNISNANHYVYLIKGALSRRLPAPFSNDPNKISKANDALDAVNNGISDASDIASDVAKNPNMSSEYNAVVNSAANLASDLSNNVSAYNDYNSMYTNASSLASGLSADHNRTANHIMTNVAVPASNIAQTYLTSDNIVFKGDSAANYTTSGIKSTTSSVSAPSGYHFNDNSSQETITFNGSTYTFDVTKNSAKPKPSSGKSKSSASSSAQSSGMPFIPTFNGGSSMVSESTSASASAEPSMASGNSFSAESKARYANYVLVTKALQLHTRANFTKKNGVAVIKPGVVLNVEKTVRARHGLVRYEVRYNNKNYFVTANKHFGVYDSYELAKPSHYRYAKVDTALQLHQSTNFTKKNGVKVVKPGMEFRINRVVKSNKGVIRYEVNYKGSVYFITANAHYVENAYLQKSNFKRGRKAVRVIKPLNEYRKLSFTKRNSIRHFTRGSVLPIKKVITIAKGEVTRLQLTNGRYVTANKDLVKVIK